MLGSKLFDIPSYLTSNNLFRQRRARKRCELRTPKSAWHVFNQVTDIKDNKRQ